MHVFGTEVRTRVNVACAMCRLTIMRFVENNFYNCYNFYQLVIAALVI